MSGKTVAILEAFHRDETGATAIEYAMIAGVMGMMLIVVLPMFSDQARELYRTINEDIMGTASKW